MMNPVLQPCKQVDVTVEAPPDINELTLAEQPFPLPSDTTPLSGGTGVHDFKHICGVNTPLEQVAKAAAGE
jgi:hypothetical protein